MKPTWVDWLSTVLVILLFGALVGTGALYLVANAEKEHGEMGSDVSR